MSNPNVHIGPEVGQIIHARMTDLFEAGHEVALARQSHIETQAQVTDHQPYVADSGNPTLEQARIRVAHVRGIIGDTNV